jgi:hypothetical protein
MTREQINRFFQTLADNLGEPATVVLIGAAAGTLWGNVHPSFDVDFAIELTKEGKHDWMKVAEAVEKTVRLTGIQANFAEDIDRWGMISLMDYRRHTMPYRRFGPLEVKLLHPIYWAIGKLNRSLVSDIKDIVTVFQRQRVSPQEASQVWGRALKSSPPSADLSLFRRHVEDFFKKHGRQIWGSSFDATSAIEIFHKAAGLKIAEP